MNQSKSLSGTCPENCVQNGYPVQDCPVHGEVRAAAVRVAELEWAVRVMRDCLNGGLHLSDEEQDRIRAALASEPGPTKEEA